MTLRTADALGSYFPAFFTLHLNVDFPISGLLGSSQESTLSHELIHFLQDASTTFGLINASHLVDVLKDLNEILIRNKSPIAVPIPARERSQSVMTNKDLFSLYLGDGSDAFTKLPGSARVISFEAGLEFIEQAQSDVAHYAVRIGLNEGNCTSFHFGALALMESMANLLERRLYELPQSLSYPYDAARMVADFICADSMLGDLELCELCEASLMFFNPAQLFIDALKRIVQEQPDFSGPNSCYTWAMRSFQLETNSAEQEFEVAAQLAAKQLDDLFTVEPIKSEHWGKRLVEAGSQFRLKGFSLSATLWALDPVRARAVLVGIIRSIGFPLTIDSSGELWVRRSDAGLFTPVLFPIFHAIHEIVEGKRTDCWMFRTCQGQVGYCETNTDCQNRPWVRSKLGMRCYFSDVWRMWGLEDVELI